MKTRMNWLMMVGALAVALVTGRATGADVTASLDPSTIAVGDSAQLTVTVSGSDSAEPQIPSVEGLDFAPAGQSSSMQSINGAVTSSVSYSYQVTANRAGSYTIPAIAVPGIGSSQPIQLRVSKSANGATTASPSNLPPPNIQAGTAEESASSSDQPAFLRAVLPTQSFVVGQRVPVQIKAYFRAGMSATLAGLPAISSDAFTLNKLGDKPDQTQETVGGDSYTVVTWTTALSAVKSGDYPVTIELPVTVRVKAKARQPRDDDSQTDPFGGMGFDDSAFDDFFGRVTEKQITLRTDLPDLKVALLPSEGRPAGFSGAVGQFQIAAQATPTKLTTGDPITVKLAVTGQGNFDRVNCNGLESSTDWKTYPMRARFEPADTAGYGGTKVFEQAVVPLEGGTQKLPSIDFSYFDPEKHQYVTRSTTPIALEVAAGSSPALSAGTAVSGSARQEVSAGDGAPDLAPNKVEPGEFVTTMRPVLFTPWFIALQAGLVAGLVGALLLHRRRERLAVDAGHLRNRATDAAVRKQLATMDRALADNSAPTFFTAARQVVQEELGRRWNLPPSRVTSAEITGRLNGTGADLKNLFAIADDVVYSGQPVPNQELQRWRQTVIHQLKELEQR